MDSEDYYKLDVLDLSEAEKLVEENKSIGYFIEGQYVKQIMNILTAETRIVARLSLGQQPEGMK